MALRALSTRSTAAPLREVPEVQTLLPAPRLPEIHPSPGGPMPEEPGSMLPPVAKA